MNISKLIFLVLLFAAIEAKAFELFFRLKPEQEAKIVSVIPPSTIQVWAEDPYSNIGAIEWSNDLVEWTTPGSRSIRRESPEGQPGVVTFYLGHSGIVLGDVIIGLKPSATYQELKHIEATHNLKSWTPFGSNRGRPVFEEVYYGQIYVTDEKPEEKIEALLNLEFIDTASASGTRIDVTVFWGYSYDNIKTQIENIPGLAFTSVRSVTFYLEVQPLDEMEIIDALSTYSFVNFAQPNYIYRW